MGKKPYYFVYASKVHRDVGFLLSGSLCTTNPLICAYEPLFRTQDAHIATHISTAYRTTPPLTYTNIKQRIALTVFVCTGQKQYMSRFATFSTWGKLRRRTLPSLKWLLRSFNA